MVRQSLQTAKSLHGDKKSADMILSPEDIRRIGLALYQGEWQTMLAHGIGITPAAVRAWLSTGSTHVQISPAIRHLITASEYVADDLELWNHPKGTKIVDRMVELIQSSRNR